MCLLVDSQFHNFEHAAHVTMSVTKLLSRIVAPKTTVGVEGREEHHRNTFGITSDPLTQIAAAFAAIIHDMNHPGVPNSQLIKEGNPLAAKYDGKSIAEQNSFDEAWKLFVSDDFKNLRRTICSTDTDLLHFRDLVLNMLMATDKAGTFILCCSRTLKVPFKGRHHSHTFSAPFHAVPASSR